MTIEAKIYFKQYLKLMFVITYKKPMMIILTILGLIMFFGAIVYLVFFPYLLNEPPIFPLVFGLITVIIPLSIYRYCKRSYSSNSRLQEKITYEFTEDKIFITGESFKTEMTWEKIFKVQELKDCILLYQSRATFNLIPKEPFGDRLNEFKDLVLKSNLKNNFKKH